MLTAKGDEVDRIVGLEMGADDYLPKPFNPRELVARINAVLRRRMPAGPPGAPATDTEIHRFANVVVLPVVVRPFEAITNPVELRLYRIRERPYVIFDRLRLSFFRVHSLIHAL